MPGHSQIFYLIYTFAIDTCEILSPMKAMVVIRQALSDPHVRFGRRLALIQRAKRILSSPAFQKGKKKKCEDFADLDLKEPNPSKSVSIKPLQFMTI